MNQTLETQDNPPESMSKNTTILVVEDEPTIGRLLHSEERNDGYKLSSASNLTNAIQELAKGDFDLVIIDLSLSKSDALDVIEGIRKAHRVAILIVSSHGQEEMRAEALFTGADDYIAKPIRLDELRSRIRHAKHRLKLVPRLIEKTVFELDRLKVELATCRVYISGEEVHLTPTEYRLLRVLIENAGRIVTHKQLLMEVWGKEYIDEVQYLRIYMGHIRKKLGEYSSKRRLLSTEPRVGYRLAI